MGILQVAGRAQGVLLKPVHLMTAVWPGRNLLLTCCGSGVHLIGAGLVSCCLTLAYSLGEGSETGVRQRVSVSDALLLLAAPAFRVPTDRGDPVSQSSSPMVWFPHVLAKSTEWRLQ